MCVRTPIFHHFMLVWWAGSIELVNWISHLQPWCYWEAFWHCLMNRCSDTLLLFRKALWSKLKSEFRMTSSLPCLDICNQKSIVKIMQFDISQKHVPQLYKTVGYEVAPFNNFLFVTWFKSIRTHALTQSFSLVVSYCYFLNDFFCMLFYRRPWSKWGEHRL